MNESDVSAKVRVALNDLGAKFYKASDRFHASVPDLIGCWCGLFICIESKMHPRKPTGLQEYELEEYHKHDAGSFVLTYHKAKKTYHVERVLTGESATFTKHKDAAIWVLKQSSLNIKSKLSNVSRAGRTMPSYTSVV